MSNIISKEIHLHSRPEGEPKSENFELVEKTISSINEDEVLVKNLWMSVDPYMRGRMIDRKSYVPPFGVGKTLEGGAIGVVIESNSPDFKKGDYVNSNLGWREYFSSKANSINSILLILVIFFRILSVLFINKDIMRSI